jgi:hypothetical protein
MMGERVETQAALFYEFDLERHVPGDHLLRSIDRFIDLSGIRARLRPFYSAIGRPSIDPELMIRMLIIVYVMGIRSERPTSAILGRLMHHVHILEANGESYRLKQTKARQASCPHNPGAQNRQGPFERAFAA